VALACDGPPSPRSGGNGDTAAAAELLLETSQGTIQIELCESAAPRAVKQLRRFALEGSASGQRIFKGLAFDFTQPHIEVRIAELELPVEIQWPVELDAESLGLHQQLVTDYAEAMSIVQGELLVEYRKKKKSGGITPKLAAMLDQWYQAHSAEFLVGVSRKEINEALGYQYQSGLASLPAVRGAVMLQPVSPTSASARLSILLADIPERTGKWMVIGRVTRGLDVAQEISVRPRIKDRRFQYQPVEPVVIERVLLANSLTEAASAP
jgi:cyclophilin family peptidyl-prolyl cis-trans isomerase